MELAVFSTRPYRGRRLDAANAGRAHKLRSSERVVKGWQDPAVNP